MNIEIVKGGETYSVDVQEGRTVLDVIQSMDSGTLKIPGMDPSKLNGLSIMAPCGGHGKCGKCRVLLRTTESLEYHLACQTKVSEGMTIILEGDRTMSISESGFSTPYAIDHGPEGHYGLAIDIGTTTVVCHLHRLSDGKRLASASCPNPQIVFGADVISRIHASMDGKLTAMQDVIVNGLIKLKEEAFAEAKIEPVEPDMAVVAGNTVMEHIAVGFPPDTIGVSPFTPVSLFGDEHDIPGLCAHTFFSPCVASYVGGDITAGILATGFFKKENPYVFVDVGTNGEMVIGSKHRMVSCATAAGPAFEGANIECGMPAAPGGISAVALGKDSFDLEVIDNIKPIGICGSGLIDAIALCLDLGAIDETGLIADPDDVEGFVSELIGEVGTQDVIFLDKKNNVYITQKDIRNIQLAKAAVCGGILTLMDELGVSFDDIEGLMIAGGFGSHIDLASAARIGLFPKQLLKCAKSVGNSAGEGASAILISQEARDCLAQIMDLCEYTELSVSKEFNEHYVDQMTFDEED